MRDAFVAGVEERAELPGVRPRSTPGAGGEHTVSAGFLTVPAARLAEDGRARPAAGGVLRPGHRGRSLRAAERGRRGARPRCPATSPRPSTSAARPRAPSGPGAPSCSPRSPRSPAGSWSTAGRPASPSPPPSSTAALTRRPPPPRRRSARTAIERWLRPVAYQTTPGRAAPAGAPEGTPALPRRVNGLLSRSTVPGPAWWPHGPVPKRASSIRRWHAKPRPTMISGMVGLRVPKDARCLGNADHP